MNAAPKIALARAYKLPKRTVGYRILIDRLWPRGIKKTELKLDAWLKDVAPSTELRKWFHADPAERFPEFKKRYLAELRNDPPQLEELLAFAREKPVLLIYGARDEQLNHAVVLQEYLLKRLQRKKTN